MKSLLLIEFSFIFNCHNLKIEPPPLFAADAPTNRKNNKKHARREQNPIQNGQIHHIHHFYEQRRQQLSFHFSNKIE